HHDTGRGRWYVTASWQIPPVPSVPIEAALAHGVIGGGLRVKTANGDISVDDARADVAAATANGDIRIGRVTQGAVSLETGHGRIEIGIRPGTAARLDAHTSFGKVQNDLDSVDRPASTDDTVEVRARTGFGDIVIRRPDSLESTSRKAE
ncbi:DUF4097 family beta strand repeat-containing protein, partial [Rhodococcus sp. NPDC057014]|uniref:DUF4097 family beta strand repeat-containing protein n=1 Tax=Rhodococcus sp. NPDC057014 TaxID=3346000 RepID=UPI003626631D